MEIIFYTETADETGGPYTYAEIYFTEEDEETPLYVRAPLEEITFDAFKAEVFRTTLAGLLNASGMSLVIDGEDVIAELKNNRNVPVEGVE